MEEIGDISEEKSPNLKVSVARVAFLPAQKGLPVSPIVTGVLAALKKAQVSVGLLKIGGALSQLTHYRRLSGKLAFSLHPGLVRTVDDLLPSVIRASSGAEIILIEGEEGIFDSFPENYAVKHSQDLVYSIRTPSILIVDGEGYKETISSVVRGFSSENVLAGISGVIVVNVNASDRETQIQSLKRAEEETGVKLVGVIPKSVKPLVDFDEMLEDGSGTSRPRLLNSLEMVQQYLDVQAIKDIAATAMGMQVPRAFVTSKSRVCRIAVADDTAMNQMFQENLDLLKREGADLVAFSPQSDDKLPAHVRAIYLPGGRLEKYAESLSANAAMKEAIQSFVREKGVIFAEGSSLAYLFSNVATAKGVNLPMLGIIKGTATFLNTEPEMDKLIFAAESSRPNFLLHDKEKMWGLRPARWAYRVEEQIQFAFRALTTKQVDATEKELEENPPVMDGFMPRQNVLGTAYQFSWSTNPIVAERFVKFSLGEGR